MTVSYTWIYVLYNLFNITIREVKEYLNVFQLCNVDVEVVHYYYLSKNIVTQRMNFKSSAFFFKFIKYSFSPKRGRRDIFLSLKTLSTSAQ